MYNSGTKAANWNSIRDEVPPHLSNAANVHEKGDKFNDDARVTSLKSTNTESTAVVNAMNRYVWYRKCLSQNRCNGYFTLWQQDSDEEAEDNKLEL